MIKINNRISLTILKMVALIIPFYFVYYGSLHEEVDTPKMKALWRYVIIGMSVYGILAFITLII